jgi:hypothetical protein
MSISRQRLQQIIKEEMSLHMSEMTDDAYNDHLRDMDDMDDEGMSMDMPDSDDDMGFDVVPDDETAMVPAGDDMGVDWSQFDTFDSDLVGSAFIQAGKDLAEENPEEAPTTEQLVARMLEILDEPSGDMDMDADEDEEEEDEEEEDEAAGEEEGALNEWIRRTNLLAGTRRRR